MFSEKSDLSIVWLTCSLLGYCLVYYGQRCHSGEMKNPEKQEGHFRIFIFGNIRVIKVIFAFRMHRFE